MDAESDERRSLAYHLSFTMSIADADARARRRRTGEKGCGGGGGGGTDGKGQEPAAAPPAFVYSGASERTELPLVAPLKSSEWEGVDLESEKVGDLEWFVSASRGMFLCFWFWVAPNLRNPMAGSVQTPRTHNTRRPLVFFSPSFSLFLFRQMRMNKGTGGQRTPTVLLLFFFFQKKKSNRIALH